MGGSCPGVTRVLGNADKLRARVLAAGCRQPA